MIEVTFMISFVNKYSSHQLERLKFIEIVTARAHNNIVIILLYQLFYVFKILSAEADRH